MKKPFIWGHRGACAYETDNTIESFKLAIEKGADGIESDVHITKDNVLIFYHDDRIEYNSKMISPSSLTFEQIQSISLKNDRKVRRKEVFAYFKDKKNYKVDDITASMSKT